MMHRGEHKREGRKGTREKRQRIERRKSF